MGREVTRAPMALWFGPGWDSVTSSQLFSLPASLRKKAFSQKSPWKKPPSSA